MGIIAKQASKNAVLSFSGVIAGAINNIFVLPEAFSDFKSGMGFVGVMVSIATICGQLFSFSTHNVLVNWIPKSKTESEERKLQGFTFFTLLVGIGIFLVSFLLGNQLLASWYVPEDRVLFNQFLIPIVIICTAQLLFLYFSGYLNSRYKSVLVTALQDPFLKIFYLTLALLYWFDFLSYEMLIWGFILSYIICAVLVFISSLSAGFKLSVTTKIISIKEILSYSIYSLLDKSAATLVLRMDLLMIAFILDLDSVAEYMLAFFIGSVVYIPFKSIQAIGNSLVSKAIGENNDKELLVIYRKSVFYSLLFGGFIFCAIWINVDDVLLVINENFRNGKWVILFIGVGKLVQVSSGVSGAIIVFSEHFKFTLRLNLILVVLTFITNLLLIPSFGINGAALATLISLLIHTALKIWFIRSKFQIQPFTEKTIHLIVLFIALTFSFTFFPELVLHPIIQGIIKGSLFTLLLVGALKVFKIVPELNSLRDVKKLF